MPSRGDDLRDLVHAKIENLRPKLLDLSRGNPLISTKLGPRSNSHIRTVDELPDILFFKLTTEEEMEFAPLPAIEEDPRDEQTDIFREAVINARLTDDAYGAAMGAVDRDSDSYLDETRKIERALKDRVRAQFGLAPRAQKSEINLSQHAKNNGIVPSYELPQAGDEHEDGRHTDDKIQTLLLPDDLERKLNSVLSKSRTWIQETGMNVLQVAFGFLEWTEDGETDSSFAPLILLPVEIKRARTPQGAKFGIIGTGDEAEFNTVLAEKLRIDFSIKIPDFDGSSIEAYFAAVSEVLPKKKNWRVRRQVAIGVFPSARMAMYHDIDPSQSRFPDSEIIKSLLAGSDSAGATPFADEYEVDEPEIESKVPCLVMDADSSQFSTLVDIADGKNVAVEGPPGTGKSQTIVNAIASALADGKKVLFVAEKLAALNVVKSRLEAVGLGEFLLPLQAEKSTREQVIESIRTRLEMRDTRSVRDYEDKLNEFRRVRGQIADYIDLIASEFEATGLTVHEILGKSIATSGCLDDVATDVLESCAVPPEKLNVSGFSALMQLGEQLEKAHLATLNAKANWKESRLMYPDRFTVEEACAIARRAAGEARALTDARARLDDWGIDGTATFDDLEALRDQLEICAEHLDRHSQDLLLRVLSDDNAASVSVFLNECASVQSDQQALSEHISVAFDPALIESLRSVEDICGRVSAETIQLDALRDRLAAEKKSAKSGRAIVAAFQPLISTCAAARTWPLDDIAKAHAIYREAGRDSIFLKTPKLAEDNAAYHLRKLCEEGLALQNARAAQEQHFSLSVDVSVEALEGCVSTLRSAGSFSFLSGAFRNAKRLFRSISRAAQFTKENAIKSLDELIAFRKRAADYLRQAEASSLFGLHYRGLETNFEPFVGLAKYYEAVFQEFGGPERQTLRSFMLDAAVKELELLPAIPATGAALTYELMGERIATADSQIKLLETAITELAPLTPQFRDQGLAVATVGDLARRLESLLGMRERLDTHQVASHVLADRFDGHRTDVAHHLPLMTWAQSVVDRSMLHGVCSAGSPSGAVEALDAALAAEQTYGATLRRLAEVAKIDPAVFTGDRPLPQAADALLAASADGEGLFAFADFAAAMMDIEPEGVMPLVAERLKQNSISGVSRQLEAVAIRTLARAAYKKLGNKLSRYKGTKLEELRASLAAKDKEIIELARRQLRAAVKSGARPPSGNGVGKKSTWTDMALLENEISKKQKFIPVRDLTQRAGNALVELKPCWMMSPLAVAQYIPKGSVEFDLCIIDEASQMPPESAIGALLRCEQAVVVGDTNQLPPSSFFKTMIDDEDADEDESVLNESILEMANGSFRPARRLRWHYRSRHSGLIKFSNKLVYDDNLIVFPSANESMARMGVEYRNVQGRYKAGTNPVEAKAVVDAIIAFMQTDPERSLGVVTLNQKQRDLIKEEFDHVLTGDRAAQKYTDAWKEKNDGLEEFFIKNLENVQGDERDVIFIGTVYGPEEIGARVMQRFGPINGLAGKRRLNVLFTRAKQKIVTFSSMTAADIEADETSNPGVYMLKRWLEYTASGVLESGQETEREPDSEFEMFVIEQLKAMGCIPVPQVGVAGYFVDIGVRHPDWPHGFILGVECDGATYHSAKSARDRDRLRQEVLEGLGWKLHRIWSTDWFNNARQECEKLRKVISDRLTSLKAREHDFVTHAATLQPSNSVVRRSNMADLFDVPKTPEVAEVKVIKQKQGGRRVEIGDTVRVRYLSDEKRTIRVTISKTQSDTSQGVVHYKTPLGKALLGAEEGDEVEVLVGSYIKSAVVEAISGRSPIAEIG